MNLPLVGVTTLFVFTLGFISTQAQTLVCPAVHTSSGWLDLFPLPCRKNSECKVMSRQHLCCKGFCTKGATAAAAIQSTNNQQNPRSVVDPSSTSTSTTQSTTTSTTTSTTPSTTTSTTPSTTTSTTPSTTTSTTPSTTTTTTTTSTPSTTTSTTTTTTTTPSTTSSTTTTTTTTLPPPPPPPPTTTTTTEFSLPFLQLLPIQRVEATTVNNNAPIKTSKRQKLVCPKPGQAPVVLFPIPCENNAQCRTSSGPDQVCCERRCVKGVPAPRPTSAPQTHQPLLGVVPRECPSAPLGELLFEVQSCKTDADCWPRICCPDGARSYCRTARARLDLVPIANQIDGPVRMFEQYLQCTAPPQYDLFPQKCSSSVDCFPNLCCAEGGKKHCRPPQRSILSLLAGVTQRVGSTFNNIRLAQANRNNV